MAHHPIVFSDTTNKNGLIQICEFWTNLGDGAISGNATLLKQFTALINAGIDDMAPYLYSFSDYLRWDDTNQTDLPIGTFDIVSGQQDYQISQDDNSLDIYNIPSVRIYTSSTGTQYYQLKEATSDDPWIDEVMSPNSNSTGVPSHFYKTGNKLYLFPKPNYSATNGCQIFFEREAAYFDSTDTTKELGIPRPFRDTPALTASHKWLVVNKGGEQMLITRLEDEIKKRMQALDDAIDGQYPHRSQITMLPIRFR